MNVDPSRLVGGKLGRHASDIANLGLMRLDIERGTAGAITAEEWCTRFRALAVRLGIGPEEGAEPCWRCGSAGWLGARLCEICNGVGRMATSAPDRCIVCDGTGAVSSGVTEPGRHGFGKSIPCAACAGSVREIPPSHERIAVLRQGAVPEKYRGYTVASYLDQPTLSASQIAAGLELGAFAADPATWTDRNRGRRSIVLTGGVGVGKTGLAVGALAESLGWARRPRFVSWLALRSQVGATYNDRTLGTRYSIIADLAAAPFLVLDDFGTSGRPASEHDVALAEELIDRRHTGSGTTLITTNLDRAGMEAEFGPRVASRLEGMAVWLDIEAEDARRLPT